MKYFAFFPEDCLIDSKQKLEKLIEENKSELDKLLKQPNLTYHNFIRPVMDMGNKITHFFTPVAHMQSVKNSEESQQAVTDCLGILAAYSTELSHNKELYQAHIKIKDNEYSKLTPAQQKVLDDSIFDFELEGVGLPDNEKKRIKDINIRLSELADEFGLNVLNATNKYELIITDESILGDMPASDKAAAKIENGWRFTLLMPSYIAFMTYCTDRQKREDVYKAYSTRAPENAKLIDEILALRAEKSKLLGFANYAEMNLKTMSAPSVDSVITFLRKLAKSGKPFAEEDFKMLSDFAGIKLEPHDIAFYSEKLMKAKYHYDEEQLRPYFEQNSVVQGMFKLLKVLFDLDFIEKSVKLWDPKAKFYEVYKSGKLTGGLYIDLEARPDKRGGAWMNDWHTNYIDSKTERHLPEAFIVCNFPVSSDGNPSLLRHDDVTTLFHEMGHALHHLLSAVDELSVSGVNGIDWDTVEFPSQFLENFAYSPEVLDMISKHYQTGESMPKELLDKVVAAKNFQAGMQLVRQLEFGLFDMLIHMEKMDHHQVQKALDGVRKEVAVVIPPVYNKFQYSFNHIFSGGYAAGYYSYKWAEMLSSDAYCEFMKNGILNKQYALKYRDTVLALGASLKMDEIYNKFLGRQPDPESILVLSGMVK